MRGSTLEFTGLAGYFVREGLLAAEVVRVAIEAAQRGGEPLVSHVVRKGLLAGDAIVACCAKHFGLPVFDLKTVDLTLLHEGIVKAELMQRYRVIPLYRDQYGLCLGMTDPTEHAAITTLGFHTGCRIRPMLVDEAELERIFQTHCRPNILYSHVETALSRMLPLQEQGTKQEQTEENDEPVAAFVDHLIQDAVGKQVSDIHIEPYEQHCRIRFRRDGLLSEAATLPGHLAARVITRLKILANLNIAERRLPQDGRIQLQKDSKLDIRVNTCPTLFGEKLALRLLDANNRPLEISALGMTDTQTQLFITSLAKPQGLILVTGPTGSGKTVTLYSALHYLNQIEKNISSVEDPVEIELSGVNQVSVNPKIGLDFAAVLRTFLRQDPDILMVGEIRDLETATIAMQAAQTGHLVLSTLHANNTHEAAKRLLAMGVADYHLTHALSLIIAQRLVRKLCVHCKQVDTNMPADIQISSAYQAAGCEHCHQGYQGRVGIFELLEPATIPSPLLWDAGLEKVGTGETSLAEVIRVLGR